MKKIIEVAQLVVRFGFTVPLHKVIFRHHVVNRHTVKLLETLLKGAEAWSRFAKIFKQNGL